MEQRKHTNIKRIYFITLFSLLVVNTFTRTDSAWLQTIGEIAITSSLILMSFLFMISWFDYRRGANRLEELYISFLILVGIFLVNYVMTERVEGADLWRTILLFLFILGSIRVKWNVRHIKIAGHVFSVAIVGYFVHWLASGMPLFAFESIYTNENYLAVVLFSMIFFIIIAIHASDRLETMYFSIVFVCSLILLFSASARSVLIGACVILAAIWAWKYRKKLFPKLFYIAMAGIALFVVLYTYLKGTWLGIRLNNLSRSLFHEKNLFSGRSDIWRNALDAIGDRPFFGYGFGVKAQDVSGATQDAHNLYLKILLEGGFVGLVVFLIFLLFIWKALYRRMDFFVARWSAFFMLGILVYESMEVTLHPHNFTIAMLQWIIITMGINFVTERPGWQYRMDRHPRPFL